MALSRGMTALRAALGAVGGGLEGYAQMQELERRRKKEEEAASLQREMTRFNALQAAGARFELPRQTPDAAARSATALEMPEMPAPMTAAGQQSMLGRALQAGMGVSKAPTGGLDTPIQLALDTTRTRQFERGAAMQPAVPQERIRIGGLDLAVRAPETDEEKALRQLDLYRRQKQVDIDLAGQKAKTDAEAAKALKDQRIQTLMDAGMERKDAIKAVELEAKYGDVVVTPSAQLSAATTRRGQDITARGQTLSYLAAMGRPTGGKAGAQTEGGVVLPSITEAINNFKSITPDQLRKISSYGVAAASAGQQQGGFAELGLTGTGSMLGIIGDSEKRYAQQAGAIADAVARASEVGVLTNFDINRFRSQILFSPGDSEKIKQEKLARAVAWGEWMASNKKAVESGQFDRITATPESVTQYQIAPRKPGESVEAYLARTGGR